MTKFNPELARLAREGVALLTKTAFVAAPDIAGRQQQQQQQAPSPGQPAPSGQPAPQDPAAAQAPQAAPQPNPATRTDVQEIVQQAMQQQQEKPKKQSIEERVAAVEGVLLRFMETQGHVNKPEANAAATGAAPAAMGAGTTGQAVNDPEMAIGGGTPGGAPGGTPPMGMDKSANKQDGKQDDVLPAEAAAGLARLAASFRKN